MTLLEQIQANTESVAIGKSGLENIVKAQGGGVAKQATRPTFAELVTGVGNIGTTPGCSLEVLATSNIKKGDLVQVTKNTDVTLSFEYYTHPSRATVNGVSCKRVTDYYCPPYVSRSGKLLVSIYQDPSTTKHKYAVPFFYKNGSWVQMKVNGSYTYAYDYTVLNYGDNSRRISYYDELTLDKMITIGTKVFHVDEANLNLEYKASFSTTYPSVNQVYMANNVIAVYTVQNKIMPSSTTQVYYYNPKTNTVTSIETLGGALRDATTNGQDVFLVSSNRYLRKYSPNGSGGYTRVGSLTIPSLDSSMYMFLGEGCTVVTACIATNSDFAVAQHFVDPVSFAWVQQNAPTYFPSTNIIIRRMTKDLRYMIVQYGQVSNHTKHNVWEWYIDENTGRAGYKNLGYLENFMNPVTTYGLDIWTEQYLFDSIYRWIGESYTPEQDVSIVKLAAGSYPYKATVDITPDLDYNLLGYAYALEDIASGGTGRVCMVKHTEATVHKALTEKAAIIDAVNDINGETV